MNEHQVRKFSTMLGIAPFKGKSGKGWLETSCPLAPWTHEKGYDRNPSFAIMVNDKGKSYFSCQGCHHKGTFANLAFKFYGFTEDAKYQEIGYQIEQEEMQVTADALPNWDDAENQDQKINKIFLPRSSLNKWPLAFHHKEPLMYLKKRGIKPMTAVQLGLRYHFGEGRVVFPVFDRNYELRGFTGRAMDNDVSPRIKDFFGLNKELLFLGEHKVFAKRHVYRYVIIVEGLMDYAKVVQSGFKNCMALLGSAITKHKFEKLIELNLPIIWMVDADAAGMDILYGPIDKVTEERDENKSILKQLSPYLPQFVVDYPKDKFDPGECSEKQIRKMVQNAELYT